MPAPNRRSAAVASSSTLALAARAQELRAAGVDVISMAVGEPDFDAPSAVREAACASVQGGNVRYTPAAGRPSLRGTIASHLNATRGIDYEPDDVCVCHSAKHALANVLWVLVEPGDEVLTLAPVWDSYLAQIVIAGGEPRVVQPRADLGPDLDAIARAIGPRTRGLMLNSPSNPSGYVWSREEIEQLTQLAHEKDLWILSDEIYARIVYDGVRPVSPATISPDARERTIIVDGSSKTFAMTGYRIGYLAGPREVTRAVARLQSQFTGSPNAISQEAFEAALREEPPEVASMVAEFDQRRELLLAGLAGIGLPTARPRGAFYAFPDVSAHLDGDDSRTFCERLLETEALAVVPGAVFRMGGHVRLSYATSLEHIGGALERLGRFLGK
ncbi:MAG: pyridoxal phosphate-dependent aminotransferase [bacterium]|nr:pyridoxal phosphate-dependent aminotransferase [bacterium]